MSFRPPLPASAPPRVRERLRAAPDGPVPLVHRSRQAVYVDVAGHCVGVVARGAALVPCALRTRAESFTPRVGEPAYLRRGVLHLDGQPLVVGRVVDVRVALLDPGTIPSASSAMDVVIPPAAVVGLVSRVGLTGPDPALFVRLLPALVGRGDGLTPLGDDLVCGWLAAHRAAGVPTPEADRAVRDLAPGTTALSAALLDCALHGEVLPELGAYLASRGTATEPAAVAALLAVGHTSGAGLLHGARLALAAVAAVAAVAAPAGTAA